MKRKTFISVTALAAAVIANAVFISSAQAINFGNMMNPSRWFDNDRYDDYYGGRYGGPYGYGPYGGYGGPYGYGPYGGGYGPYGYGPYGYGGQPSTIVVNPNSGSSAPPPRMPE